MPLEHQWTDDDSRISSDVSDDYLGSSASSLKTNNEIGRCYKSTVREYSIRISAFDVKTPRIVNKYFSFDWYVYCTAKPYDPAAGIGQESSNQLLGYFPSKATQITNHAWLAHIGLLSVYFENI